MAVIKNGTIVSFSNTPQAADDFFTWTEDALLALYNFNTVSGVLSLDVMANDLGGNAKTLYSVDDGVNYLTDLLSADPLNSSGVSTWEAIGGGDTIRIDHGKVDINLTNSISTLTGGSTNINALTASDHILDTFDYAIQLGNGALSWARVTLDIQGSNDPASISGDTTGNLSEDDTTPVTGNLTVIDPDHGESHTQAVTAGATANGLGTYSVDANGHWSYTVNNALVQYLNSGQSTTDSFVVDSLDGTAHQTVTITITGANEQQHGWHPRAADAIVYGSTYAGILRVGTDGSITDTGIQLTSGSGGAFAYGVALADVNNDGYDDVLVTGDNSYGRLYYNNGNGTFSDSGQTFSAQFQDRVTAGDIDNDGDLDVYFGNILGPSVLYQNNGGVFSPDFSLSVPGSNPPYQANGVTALFGDLNGDGYQDLYFPLAGENGGPDKIFFNDGTGHFSGSGTALPFATGDGQVRLGDVNNDGFLDIVRTPTGSSADGVLLNDGHGNFTAHQATFGPNSGSGLQLADIDGNGTLDAVTASTDGLQWWSNDGTGHFSLAATLDPNGNGHLMIADFNGDDHADIAYSAGSFINTLMNNGTGQFTLGGSLQEPNPGLFFGTDVGLLKI